MASYRRFRFTGPSRPIQAEAPAGRYFSRVRHHLAAAPSAEARGQGEAQAMRPRSGATPRPLIAGLRVSHCGPGVCGYKGDRLC
jgi:hypothetical protein